VIVKVHGGPTAAASPALSLGTQFWTSRGFAVLDVNYGGSSGYGRAYRERLKHGWGIVDLDDCANAALHMARVGRVDGQRMAISGGSAGGYTVMCALAFRDGVFQAGASHYGISDLKALLRDTHKFESRYTHWLVGPPEDDQRYHDRSPLHFVDRIGAPLLFLQGEEDRVVPPNQTEMMAQALLDRGKPFGLIMFAGEQHGFRKADTIRRALDAELNFYALLLTGTGLRA
jgi:dipeptidyl aminopeptidase/acylaminoacyl peptidase